MRGFKEAKSLHKKNYTAELVPDVEFDMVHEVMDFPIFSLPARDSYITPWYDFECPANITIYPKEVVFIYTDVAVNMLPDECLYIQGNVQGLLVVDKVIYGNASNIWVYAENQTDEPVTIPKGQLFIKGMFQKYLVTANDKPRQ